MDLKLLFIPRLTLKNKRKLPSVTSVKQEQTKLRLIVGVGVHAKKDVLEEV